MNRKIFLRDDYKRQQYNKGNKQRRQNCSGLEFPLGVDPGAIFTQMMRDSLCPEQSQHLLGINTQHRVGGSTNNITQYFPRPGSSRNFQESQGSDTDFILPYIKEEPIDDYEDNSDQVMKSRFSHMEPRRNTPSPQTRVIKVLSGAPKVSNRGGQHGRPFNQSHVPREMELILSSIKQEPTDDGYEYSSQRSLSPAQSMSRPKTPMYCFPLNETIKLGQRIKKIPYLEEGRPEKGRRGGRRGGSQRGGSAKPGKKPAAFWPLDRLDCHRPTPVLVRQPVEVLTQPGRNQALSRQQFSPERRPEGLSRNEKLREFRSTDAEAICLRPWSDDPFETLSIPESPSDSILADLNPDRFHRIFPGISMERRILACYPNSSWNNMNSQLSSRACLMSEEDPKLPDTEKYIYRPTIVEAKPQKRPYRKRASKISLTVEDLRAKLCPTPLEVNYKLEMAAKQQLPVEIHTGFAANVTD